jgi:hypothetical protein
VEGSLAFGGVDKVSARSHVISTAIHRLFPHRLWVKPQFSQHARCWACGDGLGGEVAAGGRSHLSWVSSQSAEGLVWACRSLLKVWKREGSIKDWRRDGGRWRVEVGRVGVQILMGNNKSSRPDNINLDLTWACRGPDEKTQGQAGRECYGQQVRTLPVPTLFPSSGLAPLWALLEP